MVEALVSDTGKYLAMIEDLRVALEGLIASGSDDDKIRPSTQSLAKAVLDYRAAAAHAKRHCQKPKKDKSQEPPAAVPANTAVPPAAVP